MAKCETITLSTVTPTLIFSGCGRIVIQLVTGTGVFIGGPDVNDSDRGLSANGMEVELHSHDDIYAIATTGGPTPSVKVFSCR